MNNLRQQCEDALNKVCKWRTVFSGWSLGTRAKGDPESDALRDHREVTILLRVELSALVRLLKEKKTLGDAEYMAAIIAEAEFLDKAYERKFPGFQTTQYGVVIDPQKASETTKGWKP